MNTKFNNQYSCYNISKIQLSSVDPETQYEIMRDWFFQNYEDPQEECPYDSEEGRYIYPWGGPYYAEDVLFNEFDGIIPSNVINELVEELNNEGPEWSAIWSPEDTTDEYSLDAFVSAENPIGGLRSSIDSFRELLNVSTQSHLEQTMLQMIFVRAITAMETYLSEFFVREISTSEDNLRTFIENNTKFKEQKFSLSNIFTESENIKKYAEKYLSNLLWHDLSKIKKMFKSSLQIEFSNSISELFRDVRRRHDFVHRGEKSKDGKTITINKVQVYELLNRVLAFAEHIETENTPPF